MFKRLAPILALPLTLTLTVAAPASAHGVYRHRLSSLSTSTAAVLADDYAEREGHRIWRIQDQKVASSCFKWGQPYEAECTMTLGLCYSEEGEPVRLNAKLLVHKVGSWSFRYRLEREWEELPAGDPGVEAPLRPEEGEEANPCASGLEGSQPAA
jgi:hypothetical protein